MQDAYTEAFDGDEKHYTDMDDIGDYAHVFGAQAEEKLHLLNTVSEIYEGSGLESTVEQVKMAKELQNRMKDSNSSFEKVLEDDPEFVSELREVTEDSYLTKAYAGFKNVENRLK
jgi:hypothetical protein